MIQIFIKNLPNTLSVFRIALSALLFFITNNLTLFFVVYTIAGITDVTDGFIARKFHMETTIGSKLDSLADFIFLSASLARTVLSYQLNIPANILLFCCVITVLRIINLIITKVKFQQWGMLHSMGNKFTGLIIFFICPIAILTGQFPFFTVIIPLISALEETVLLMYSKKYNPNEKSIFHSLRTGSFTKSNRIEVSENG